MASSTFKSLDVPSPQGRPKVLIIDDDPAVRRALTGVLADGYEVLGAGSGSESIALLDHDIHAIVLDFKMRGEEGRWTFQAIRKRFADIPIIFFSSFKDLKDPYEIINECRPFGYLRKSADPAELRRLVDEAAAHHANRRRREAQLLIADRLAAVGTLAAGAAHEINNPLGYIIGNIEYVLEELAQVGHVFEHDRLAEMDTALVAALDGAQRIAQIINELRSFGGLETRRGGEGKSDVREVLERTARLAGNEIRHRARLVTSYEEVPLVAADPEPLSQIFLNLIVNAAQALPLGQAEEHEIRIRTFRDGRYSVVVEIQDTGPGIPPAIRERIFDPFFTTKAPNLGTGLGLFVTHNLVEELGGAVHIVESGPVQGTTFQVVLPVVGATTTSSAWEVAPQQSEEPLGRILVIDDDPLVGISLRRILDMYEVTVVERGEAALELCRHEVFDVILCDVMMPDLGGIEVYEALTAQAPKLARRIVFITGGVFDPEIAAFIDDVPNRRLEKPLRRNQLLRFIEERLRAE